MYGAKVGHWDRANGGRRKRLADRPLFEEAPGLIPRRWRIHQHSRGFVDCGVRSGCDYLQMRSSERRKQLYGMGGFFREPAGLSDEASEDQFAVDVCERIAQSDREYRHAASRARLNIQDVLACQSDA